MQYVNVIGTLLTIVFPVAASASLPLSYRNQKPIWAMWITACVLSVLGAIALVILIYVLSSVAGMTGNRHDITKASAWMYLNVFLPYLAMSFWPLLLGLLLHRSGAKWQGKMGSQLTEACIVIAGIAAVPFVVGLIAISNLLATVNPPTH